MGVSRVGVTEEGGLRVSSRVSVNQAVAGSVTLKVAQLGKKHRVESALLTLSGDGTMQFFSAGNPLTGPMDVGAKGGFSQKDLGGLIEANENEDLILTTTGGAARGVVRVSTE